MGAGASVDQGVATNAQVREVLQQQVSAALPEGSPIQEQYRAAFGRFDANGDGFVSPDEFLAAVSALGQAWSQAECDEILGRIDLDQDGKVSFEDFSGFMVSDDAPAPPAVDEARLKQVFLEFCSFGSQDVVRELDSSKMAKLTRDCGLLAQGQLTKTDVDLIFTKAKIKGARKIAYQQFKEIAVPLMAAKRFPHETPEMQVALLSNLINAAAPQSSGTKADTDGALARMTDESQYTGSHAHRRSSTGAGATTKRRSSIAKLAGAEDSAAQEQAAAVAAAALAPAPADGPEPDAIVPPGERVDPLAEPEVVAVLFDEEALKRCFLQFASFGSSEVIQDMDGAKFAKMARESRLLDKHLTRTDVDLIFASAKPKTARKMSFTAFSRNALPALAHKKFPKLPGDEATSALAAVLAECAPATSGTQIDSDSTLNRLSVAGAGEGGAVARRSISIGRRASNGENAAADIADTHAAAAAQVEHEQRSLSRGSRRGSSSAASLPPAAPDMDAAGMPMNREQLNNLFLQFSSFGSSEVKYDIDSAKFLKLWKDCGVLHKTKLTNTDIDLIFTKSKEKGERRLSYEQFEQVALPLVAQKRFGAGADDAAVFENIKKVLAKLASAAPQSSGTKADADGTLARMTDESQYTGTHRRSSASAPRRSSVSAQAAAAAAAQ